MSNCIKLYPSKRRVRFTADEIKMSAYFQFLNKVNVAKSYDDMHKLSNDEQCAWWFLAENSAFFAEGQITDFVEITFGDGRSSHTWRDFKGTLQVLSQFILKERIHTFVASDESDGHEERFPIKVSFKRGIILGELTAEECKAAADKIMAAWVITPLTIEELNAKRRS